MRSGASQSTEEGFRGSTVLDLPLTQYMFSAPGERATAVVMCRTDITHHYTERTVYRRAAEVRTRR